MKKRLFSLGMIAAAVVAINGCSNKDFAELYPDPSKTTKASVDKLMTGVFRESLNMVNPIQTGVEYLDLTVYGKWAGTIGFPMDGYGFRVPQSPQYRWDPFYKTLTQFRALEDVYSKLDETGKTNYEVFKVIAEIFVYEELQQMVDLWDKIPFDQAGTLPITGDAVASKPKYQDGEELYAKILDNVKVLEERLASFGDDGENLSALAKATLPVQDYICKGKILSWRRFANSLRLRTAMRAALNQSSIQQKAQDVLKEMLETNPSKYPVIDDNEDNITIAADNDGFRHGNEMRSSYQADGGVNQIAPWFLVNVLTSNNDPRLPVMFTKNKEGDYIGLKHDESPAVQTSKRSQSLYSRIDSATFGWNDNYPAVLFSAAEIAFIKAEAYQRSYISGGTDKAKEAFENAVRQSIEFYFWLNSLSSWHAPKELTLGAAEMSAYADQLWDANANKEEIIATQKWVHFSLFEQREAYAELRRTGLPNLTFQRATTANAFELPCARFIYPESESLYNTKNMEEANGGPRESNATQYQREIFWAKKNDANGPTWYTIIPAVQE